MARKRTEFSHASDQLLRTGLAHGLTAVEIADRLKASGAKGASRSTVGRRLAELRGPVATSRTSHPRPLPAPAVVPSPRHLVTCILMEWCYGQPDPAEAYEAVCADLVAIAADAAALRAGVAQ